jgi:hypothetical protein
MDTPRSLATSLDGTPLDSSFLADSILLMRAKLVHGKLHDLREHSLARIHKNPPEESTLESYSNMNGLISNRHQNNLLENSRQSFISAHSLLI